jgi:hypothetical protein
MEGELIVEVFDSTGLPVPARVELENRVAKFQDLTHIPIAEPLS